MRKAKRRSSIFGIIVFSDPGLCKDNKRMTGMQKASMQTAGAKQCYAFVIVRIKIDIAAEEETSARQFQEERSRMDGETKRDREKR